MSQPKVVLLGILAFALTVAAAWAQEPKELTRESSLTATVDKIDRFTRTVTVKTGEGMQQAFYVGPEIKEFDELQTGDTVTVRFTDSLIVQVRPGAKPGPPVETTAQARKGASPFGRDWPRYAALRSFGLAALGTLRSSASTLATMVSVALLMICVCVAGSSGILPLWMAASSRCTRSKARDLT